MIAPAEIVAGRGWPAIFGNHNPLKVDVGCGHGHFLTAMAQAEPESNFIGIDIYAKSLARAQRKIDRLQLTNVRLLAMPAQAAFATAFRSGQVAEVYINFPDPWPKRRHAPRRLVQPPLVALLHDRLQAQGVVTVATDVADYAREMLQQFLAHGGFRSCLAGGIVSGLPDRLPTLYETKFRQQGLPLYYFKLCKISSRPWPANAEGRHDPASR
ncbi:MAG: tRNA (guanosine(46)-N7)-methyltransferase TrmB [candidate division KSB1 bacterium]|nr:tRNA (guanosine(46)-N7)-methyltransferase TrmB [candidate division KSB1 bacterium]MDZ7286929.1 tRNA (guanosine(46)-N7)-methyltransferase TrmB [candidate division KSB1 bacterium]MDZ7299718.1 tRNA (guanosine(46)-N7)-methyltransferase TrmB [candidate division KSB1 bacterium]MDZ7350705.1 tRNA (guanosine(46)-N7)-methyltransferase TrmB [candidate division KSB1 bacterium]MDZ7383528.1 tRNA (guanosine(46)-N7)-methyltransferase TrmB [candidate division KSB1 bacterium]